MYTKSLIQLLLSGGSAQGIGDVWGLGCREVYGIWGCIRATVYRTFRDMKGVK